MSCHEAQVARHIHELPYQTLNQILFLSLAHGSVHLSEKAIRHIRERHPADCELCLAHMEAVIVTPDYAGQSPLHPDNFVLIKQVNGLYLMVAISTVPDEHGEYPVQSSYTLSNSALQRRLRKGYLKQIVEKRASC